MRYQDFEIKISPSGDAGFTVSVLRSPAGEGEDSFEPPFDRDRLPVLLHRLNARIRGARHSRPSAPASATTTPREIGEALFSALFSGRVRDLYQSSVSGVGDGGLRIKLRLNPRLSEMAQIQNLPWELLARPEDVGFLALSPDRPIVRYLDVQEPVRSPPLPLRLRILLVSSQPADLPPLDLAEERRRLLAVRSIWKGRARLRIVPLPDASLAGLRQALQAETFHVLHFMGHGSLDPESGEGSLELMAGDGRSVDVGAGDLGSLLGGFKSLRLVVLNACSTAEAAEPESTTEEVEASGYQPFAGVAQALIRKGLPAVVAMQREISDRAAIAFSEAFYRRLAAGEPVDAAVAEGRQAIRDRDPGGLEWSTPALFMRASDGVLFRKRPSLRRFAALLAGVAFAVILAWLGYDWKQRTETAEHDNRRRVEAVEHNNRGTTLLQNGQLDDARQAFQAALDADPDSAVAHNNLARVDFLVGEYELAEDGYRKAIALDGNEAIYHYHLGTTLLVLREAPAAVESLERALELDADYLPAYNELAKAYRELWRFSDARRTLEEALTRLPEKQRPELSAPLYKNLGQVEMGAGRPAAAGPHFLDARSRYLPSNVVDLAEVAFLLAAAHGQLDESAQVCRWLGEAQRHAPDLVGLGKPGEPAALAAKHGCSLDPQEEGENE